MSEKKKMKGIFHVAKTTEDIISEMVDEKILPGKYIPKEGDVENKESHAGEAYILAIGSNEFFRVSEKEETKAKVNKEFKIKEGSLVLFETPKKQTGKFRWAYNITPA